MLCLKGIQSTIMVTDKSKASRKKDSYKNEIIIAFVFVAFVVIVWLSFWCYVDTKVFSSDATILTHEAARGVFGDKFGAVNALFSGLAFAGIIFTILLQRKELEYQREELISTREVFEKQNETLEQQKFESTFFQLLSLFHSIVNGLDLRKKYDTSNVISQGRDCFKTLYREFKRDVCDPIDPFTGRITDLDTTLKLYAQFYEKHKSELSHYFRTLYHIYKFLDSSCLNNKRQYSSIVRAQLSSYEQIFLFYNCLHDHGKDKFKPLIEKYSVFNNLDESLLFNSKHLDGYANSAYE